MSEYARSLDGRSRSLDSISSVSDNAHALDAGGWCEPAVVFYLSPSTGATLTVNLEELLLSLSVGPLHLDSIGGHTSTRNDFEAKRIYLRALISSLLTHGLNADIDRLCQEKLQNRQLLFGLCRSV
jgi:hypothetical protein